VHFRTLACCCQHIKEVHVAGCPWNKKLLENKEIYKNYGKNPKDGTPFGNDKALELATCDACTAHDPLAKS
jgi:hypothetical protein